MDGNLKCRRVPKVYHHFQARAGERTTYT